MNLRFTQLLFLLFFTGILCAQSPGGVGSPELWFKTQPLGSDLRGEYHWKDFSGDNLRLNIYSDGGAGVGTEFTTKTVLFVNGHPAINFYKALDSKSRNVQLKRTNLSQATLIGLFIPDRDLDKEYLLYGLYGRPGQGVWVSNDKVFPSVESGKSVFDFGETEGMDLKYSSNDAEGSLKNYQTVSARIAAYYRSVSPSTTIWGERDRAVLSFGSTYKTIDVNKNSTFNIPSASNRTFQGLVPEFIAYNRLLTPLERRKVDTYLAIKYGLTIPVSYIGSKDQLLWDYDANTNFRSRITGLYRDDASGLYQMEAATTYEDSPTFTATEDFFYGANPYNKSSSSRLLHISRQPGNSLIDGNYLLWSDNNAGISLKPVDGKVGLELLDRTWLAKTNIPANSNEYIDWTVTALDYTIDALKNGIRLTKPYSSKTPEFGTLVTEQTLAQTTGYLGLSDVNLRGHTYLKFGTNQPNVTSGTHDYGYYFEYGILSTKVYLIQEGNRASTSSFTVSATNDLELVKKGNLIYLLKNGTREPKSEITINPQHENAQFYGAIIARRGSSNSTMFVRHGGFVDTGNRVELSYAANKASDFESRTKGRAYMVIDPTGQGDFTSANAKYIESSSFDGTRRKFIFDNVFFDEDRNGEDMFTFAYKESDISGEIEIEEPDCNMDNGVATITLTEGSPAFKWSVTDLRTNQIIRTGTSYERVIRIENLRGGEYEFSVQEAGGFNFVNTDPNVTPTRAKTTNFFPVYEGNIEWPISSTTDTYMVGWTNFTENVKNPKNIIHYGLKKEGNKLFKIVEGQLENTTVTVLEGDIITISKTMDKIYYRKNGVEFSTNSIKWYDVPLKFYGLIDMSNGPAALYNVQAQGFFNLADYHWTRTDNIELGYSRDAKLSFPFEVHDLCDSGATPPITPDKVEDAVQNNLLRVSTMPGTRQLNAEVELDTPEPVSFVVYDLNGNTVKIVEQKTPQKVQTATINVPTTGIFIIKAITPSKDHNRKVIVE